MRKGKEDEVKLTKNEAWRAEAQSIHKRKRSFPFYLIVFSVCFCLYPRLVDEKIDVSMLTDGSRVPHLHFVFSAFSQLPNAEASA